MKNTWTSPNTISVSWCANYLRGQSIVY